MRLQAFLLTFAISCSLATAAGAELAGSDSGLAPGSTVLIPLTLVSQDSAISGVQFDIDWDDSLTSVVLIGSAARTAEKSLYQAALGPHTTRCLIIGLNQGTLSDGELARIFVSAQVSASLGVRDLTLTNVVATDPDGQPVPISARTVHITVQANGGIGQILQPSGVLNAASMLAGAIAPGEIVTLLGPGTESVSPPVSAEQITVLVNGIRAPLMYVGGNQINAVVPFGVETGTPAVVEMQAADQTVASSVVPVASFQPGIFTQDFSGNGPGAILNQDYTVNSYTNPADPGSIVMVFATGLGQTDPPGADGQAPDDIRNLKAPVTATIGNQDAEVTYAGSAPGLISGISQVNVRVPNSVSGVLTAPIVLHTGSAETQAGVTLSVR